MPEHALLGLIVEDECLELYVCAYVIRTVYMYMHIHMYILLHFRSKIQDLNSEIAQMTQEIEAYNQESATYLTFEKRLGKHLHVHVHVYHNIK